ncbi:MAG: hypothetical protein ABIT71_25490 [Vicinamibacteraceae bacterium]
MSREERLTGLWLIAGLAAVFAIDSMFPLGVASGMIYVPLLFGCQPEHGRRWLMLVAAVSTALIVLDLSLGIGGAISPPWVYLTNRGGSIAVLWTIALLLRHSFVLEAAHDAAVERAAALAERRVLGGLLPICASCKRIQRSDDVWQSLEAYIQAHSEASFSHGLCPSCLVSLYPDLPPLR